MAEGAIPLEPARVKRDIFLPALFSPDSADSI